MNEKSNKCDLKIIESCLQYTINRQILDRRRIRDYKIIIAFQKMAMIDGKWRLSHMNEGSNEISVTRFLHHSSSLKYHP